LNTGIRVIQDERAAAILFIGSTAELLQRLVFQLLMPGAGDEADESSRRTGGRLAEAAAGECGTRRSGEWREHADSSSVGLGSV
jgi:hypothetical protein